MLSKLRRFARRPSPSMVVAFIALIVAGGGATYAAIPDSGDGEIHGCYGNQSGDLRVINAEAGETCGKRETALPWNQQGPPGTNGTNGTNGTDGTDAASMLTGRVTGDVIGESTTVYASPNGQSTYSSSADPVSHPSPGRFVARDLFVRAGVSNVDPEGPTGTMTFTLIAEGDTEPSQLSCTAQVGAADGPGFRQNCNSGTATGPMSCASCDVVLKIETSANVRIHPESLRGLSFGWRATTP